MNTSAIAASGPLAAISIGLGPSSLVDFTVAVANLVLTAVMVAIFGAALLLPFPAGVMRTWA